MKKGNPGGPSNVATEGQGGTEMGLLTEDQRLRQEALTRTSTRNIAELGLANTRGVQDIQEKNTEGTYDAQKSAAEREQQINEQKQQDILQRAQLLQSQAASDRSNKLQEASLKAEGIAV